jgi:hypothetical protein
MADRRGTYAAVLAVGVVSGALVAVTSTWTLLDIEGFAAGGDGSTLGDGPTTDLPLASTLSMVVLAAWGVLAVTRGRVRRAVAALGASAAVGVLVTVVVGGLQLPGTAGDDLARVGARPDITLSTSYWLVLALSLVSAAATVAAFVLVPTWPAMGTRYDTPDGAGSRVEGQPDDDLALWKALDEGRDPTA